ncbi:hypothetical protein IPJ70_03290 [Candidatus Campbellbacteria bacterium]|nr:MAG: hypothetical protein IPJ70_03290 [Candidatus Campbellbacteria bacterium]
MTNELVVWNDFGQIDRKFILAEVGSSPLVVLRIGEGYHRELFKKLREEVGNQKIQCLGGGKIQAFADFKHIWIFEESADFGMEPREVTEEIVRRHFPDATLEIEVSA